MERWVGLGVIANNLTVIGNEIAKRRNRTKLAAEIVG